MANFGQQPQMVMTNMGAASVPLLPPGQVMWLQRPQPIPGCPVGLEYLLNIDQLNTQQIVSLMEAFTGWETNNKYSIRNSAGFQLFYAMEKTTTCMRMCCGPQRSFTIHIVDYLNQEVFRVNRDFKCCAGWSCCAGCCDGCAHEVMVTEPDGKILGYVKQKGSFIRPKFAILNENHEPVLKLEGPLCIVDGPCCPFNNQFRLLTLDGQTEVGKIQKEYSGFLNELVTTADRFGITFPVDMSVKTKATLIGAMFLIDFMFFENKQKQNSS